MTALYVEEDHAYYPHTLRDLRIQQRLTEIPHAEREAAEEALATRPASAIFRGNGGAAWRGLDDGPGGRDPRRQAAANDNLSAANDNLAPSKHRRPALNLARQGALMPTPHENLHAAVILRTVEALHDRAHDTPQMQEADNTGRQVDTSLRMGPSPDRLVALWAERHTDEPSDPEGVRLAERSANGGPMGAPSISNCERRPDGTPIGVPFLARVGGLYFDHAGQVVARRTARGRYAVREAYGAPKGTRNDARQEPEPVDLCLYGGAALPRNPWTGELEVGFVAGRTAPSEDRAAMDAPTHIGQRPPASEFDPWSAWSASEDVKHYCRQMTAIRREILSGGRKDRASMQRAVDMDEALVDAACGVSFDLIGGGPRGNKQAQRRGLALIRSILNKLLENDYLGVLKTHARAVYE